MTNQQTKKETEKVEWDWTKTQNTGYYDGRPVSISQSTRTIELNEMTIPQTEKVECNDPDCKMPSYAHNKVKPEGVGEWEYMGTLFGKKWQMEKLTDYERKSVKEFMEGKAFQFFGGRQIFDELLKDNLLLQEKAKWKEKIEGLKACSYPFDTEKDKEDRFNQALEVVLALIDKL